MPRFNYKGRNNAGGLVRGQLQAATASEVATSLFNDNIIPVEIVEFNAKATSQTTSTKDNKGVNAGKRAGLFREKISIVDLIIFSRQMYSLTKAGIALDKALRGLRDSISNLEMKKVLHDVGQQLEKGMALTDSMGRHPEVFSQLYLSLIHVGENTGRLDLSFQQIGKYLELERETAKQIKSATRYPIFVMATIAVALAIITMFVIPVFAETFARFDAQLPWQTILLISISDFVIAYWYLILGFLGGVFFASKYYVSTPKGRLAWDEKKLRLPLVGNIYERVALSRFSRTFAMMMTAGVPIVQALGVISRAVGNVFIGENIIGLRESISRGDTLYDASIKSGMFSPLVLQMISVGEESGDIGDLLAEVADFYDSEVEYDLKRLSAAIEPILIVCVAGMVLVLALGVFLPIWDLANAVR